MRWAIGRSGEKQWAMTSTNTQKYPVYHHQREKNWDWYDVGKCDRFTRIEIFTI
ncbi:MAG: hypothetical protein JGK17_13785 [Microcoleus sp. PH2017_10_PVI_O_A]|uniref:hypothetical protein n=1 Tax=unclassified Microcoleus TaxID=2642155 RepID=UPI001D29CF90|nr:MULTISPECIES: hypothetical protein [unclassified Microcoleus]MCC3406634.1 hypothetical protein [Microcoleus sp. PH2017_10_PVI_O_A]MCC3460646.1 hypothetical protein [Microcoleus sp. PH2017_11_PCY_U_A]MCC3479193.1 hypothetical protein [Microcoleus sp. PH2017_12_PCY_D_A]MCC3560034.1 hypothetical protein [Microcoleus sp. PH2017_27_LUM_O_A]